MEYQFINQLRDYQALAIEMAYKFIKENESGNPCIVMPTGSGKSWVIAGMCENTLRTSQGEGRILLLTHQKELLVQDCDKILKAWPEAPVGVFCAGLRSKELNKITVASVQSLAKHTELLGHVDLTIVDEAHMIGGKTKNYQSILKRLYQINSRMRVVGLTATAYRLDQGRLDQGEDALFSKCLEPVSIDELIALKFLSPLKSRFEGSEKLFKLDVSKVRTMGKFGDYRNGDLEKAINTDDINARIVKESIMFGQDRKSWLFFCVTKQHARDLCAVLNTMGIPSSYVLGDSKDRDQTLVDFKTGKIRAITSVGVLTTGFDFPGIDMMVFARPTKSPGLYVQMAGRGMRMAPGKENCLVLDFAGLVEMHGPITMVTPPPAPTKTCPKCGKIIKQSTMRCNHCGYEYKKQCPKCGRSYGMNAQVCTCGHKFKKQCRCGAYLDEWEQICPFCGNIFYKECPKCGSAVKLGVPACPKCGHIFPKRPEITFKSKIHTRHNEDIMGTLVELPIKRWCWSVRNAKKTNIPMLVITYYPAQNLAYLPTNEYICICHDGWAGEKAKRIFFNILENVKTKNGSKIPYIENVDKTDLQKIADMMNNDILSPQTIKYREKDNKFPEILERIWACAS